MQAIGMMAGEHRYLIPLASVSGVTRMSPGDFQSLLENEKPMYEFAGEPYSILELEPLLGEPSTPLGDDTISILIIKTLGESTQVNYIGLVIQGLPRLRKVSPTTLVEKSTDELPDTVFSRVSIEDLQAVIPRLGKLTRIVERTAYET